jgi:hypothetical protein
MGCANRAVGAGLVVAEAPKKSANRKLHHYLVAGI